MQQVRLLGPVDVTVDGVPRAVRGLRRKAVLAALAMAPGEVIGTDRLIELVWVSDAPATAPNTLQSHVSHLRQVLGGRDTILARPPGYVLLIGTDGTDVARAEGLARQAAAESDLARRVRHLRDALDLWRGAALADLVGLTGLDHEAERLDGLQLRLQRDLLDARLRLGEHEQLVLELAGLVREQPFDESLHGQLMLALYRSGRQSDALVAYQRLRRRLGDDLGLDPGPALRELESAILRQDPVLDAPASARESGSVAATATRPAGPTAPSTPPGPAQLPLAVRGFTGRQAELAQLDALLPECAGDAVVVAAVSGPPGVGKSSLALHWAHRVADRFPDGQLYVNLRGFDPRGAALAPADAVRGFLDALRVPVERIPADRDAQESLYRSELAGRRVLIVADNARDAEQVRALLPGTPGCLVVVTSRNQLTPLVVATGAHPIALDVMSAGEAGELLARRLGPDRVAREPEAVAEIIAGCDRLPLALGIVAAHAKARPDAPLAGPAAQLRPAAGGLDAFDGGDPTTNVRVVFSWSYRALSDPAARLFRLLGLHPGPDLAIAAAASLAGITGPPARALLAELVQANLLTEPVPGRYGLHDLLRAYAAELVMPDERRPAVHRLLEHYLRSAHAAVLCLDPARAPLTFTDVPPGVLVVAPADREAALAWFAAEAPALQAAIGLAADDGYDRHAWQLAWTMTTYFDWSGHWHDLISTQTAALTVLLHLDEPAGRAHAHRDLGRTLAWVGQYDTADSHLQQALRQYTELGDVVGAARTHMNIGWMLQTQDRHQAALGHSERAHDLFRAAGDELWQARALNSCGWLHSQLGDHRQALARCGEALTLLEKVDDRHGAGSTWDSLGYAHHQLGAYADAVDCYRQALALFAELGDRSSGAEVLIHLGDTQDAAGDREAAYRTWREALAVLDELGHPAAEQARTRLHG